MKRVFYILIGAAAFGVVGYFALDAFASWFGPRHIHSDDDISRVFFYMLIALSVFIVVGGMVGNWLAKRSAEFSRDQ